MITDIHTHNAKTHAKTIATVGVHPWQALESDLTDVELLAPSVDAIGEIGLDFVCNIPKGQQIAIFKAQLSLAEQHKKPVILHCVRAFETVMKILSEYHLAAVIFHGFVGSVEQAQQAIEQGYYLSFGERTFRSPKTIAALRSTPLSQLFVETDESSTPIEEIYAYLAELYGTSVADLTAATGENFNRIFNS